MEGIILLVMVFVGIIYTGITSYISKKKKTKERIINEYNVKVERNINYDTYNELKSYFYDNVKAGDNYIDDDTWDDLNMDRVYVDINNTNSSVGREYLYSFLRRPSDDIEELKKRDFIANEFHNNEDSRIKIQMLCSELGYGRYSIYQYLKIICEFVPKKNYLHYFCIVLFISALAALLTFNNSASIGYLVFSLFVSLITYFKEKASIERYFDCVKWIARLIDTSKKIVKVNVNGLEKEYEELKQIINSTASISKNLFLLTTGNGNGSLEEVILEYVRMITHVDLIKFNNVVIQINRHYDEIKRMYEIIGYIEANIAIAAYRNKLSYWTSPNLAKGNDYKVVGLYHPLLEEPVANSINADCNILLTGSNASGKSTFLRSVALNALLSQTIYTSTSREYSGDFYRIISSMSHRDSIVDGDSYYMVEIKALKRILDISKQEKLKLLCFLDEVLRGTNTVERIAASTQILRSFTKTNTLCFAATHDIELTSLLNDCFSNYHFDEKFVNDDVRYSYVIKNGPATSRNAIKLLNKMGYDKELINDANKMTEYFEENGIWKF